MEKQTYSVILTRDKECKGSVRFVAQTSTTEKPPIQDNAYLSRGYDFVNKAKRVKITVEEIE